MIPYGHDHTCPHGEPPHDCHKCPPPVDLWEGMTGPNGAVVAIADYRDNPEQTNNPITLTPADTITMEGVNWTYDGRIPVGMVTLLAGREGIGKSTIALDVAARLTKGKLAGRYEGTPRNVVVVATEDSWRHTITPRLVAVGADLSRVYCVQAHSDDRGMRPLSVPQDVRHFKEAFAAAEPALLIIDPLMSLISGKVDSHNQKEVQQSLEPLVKLCEEIDLSVLALVHVNKAGGNGDALNAIMGSKAFATLPRSILFCTRDSDEEGLFALTHEKCNVGPRAHGIQYRILDVRVELPEEQATRSDRPWIPSSRIQWGDAETRSAGDMMAQQQQAAGGHGEAAQQLLAYVNDADGVVTRDQIHAEFDGDLSRDQIRNALSRMSKKGLIVRVSRAVYQSVKISREDLTRGESEMREERD